MPSNHLILCCPFLLLPSIFPSIRVFSNESVLHIRLPKYWSFSFSISPSNEYAGLISFRMDWLDLLAVQGTLKTLLYHSLEKFIMWLFTESLSISDGTSDVSSHQTVIIPLTSVPSLKVNNIKTFKIKKIKGTSQEKDTSQRNFFHNCIFTEKYIRIM